MIDQLILIYSQFLSLFPPELHFWISLIIFLVLVFWLLDLVKRSLLWLVLLIVLLPASVPILRQIFNGILSFLRFLLAKNGA